MNEVALFYAPWHQKEGELNATIEEVIEDQGYRSIQLCDVRNYPLKLKEAIESIQVLPSSFIPFPVATDSTIGKTLVLDGNRTLVRMLQDQEKWKGDVEVIEVIGEGLERLIPDFAILKRFHSIQSC